MLRSNTDSKFHHMININDLKKAAGGKRSRFRTKKLKKNI